MKRKIAVFYYTQSGQALAIAKSVMAGAQRLAPDAFEVVYKEIKPTHKFPYPWTNSEFFDAFPESRLGLPPCEIESFDLSDVTDASLVVVAGQSWFLSPSLPLQAFFADAGTYPLLGQMYWIKSVPEHLPDLRPLILNAITKNCDNMLSQPRFVKIAGVNGIEYLSRRIRRWETTMGKRRAALNLAQVIRMLEEIGTGGAGFRFIYAAFLQEAGKTTGLDELADFSRRMTAIGDKWREFAYMASRIYKKRKGENYTYDQLGDILAVIADMERRFFTELKTTVKSIR